MADVYLALANGAAGFNKLVALKLLHQGACNEPETVGMFQDEARLAARLHHENLIDTYEAGEIGGRPFIAMEYLQGQALSRVKRRVPNLPLELKLWVIVRTLAGLHYAHELRARGGAPLGIVHRDVSPSNLMLTYDGRVKLLDFGIAKASSAENLSRVGMFKGKIGYCSPEQLLASRVDRRADIFSAGVTLWELLVGRRLWPMNDLSALQRRVEGREDLRSGTAHVPEHLLTLCERAMAREPENRFATAEDMATAIEAHLPLSSFRDAPRILVGLLSSEFRDDRAKLQARIERHLAETKSAREAALNRDTVPELDAELGAVAGVLSQMRTLWLGRHRAALSGNWPGTAWRQRWRLLAAFGVLAVVGLVVIRRGATQRTMPVQQARFDESKRVTVKTRLSASLPAPSAERASPIAGLPSAIPALSLTIRASPSSARLYLDGVPLASNPYVHTSPRDTRVHTISARAPGFEPEEMRLTFDESRECEFKLKRLRPRWTHLDGNSASRRRAPPRPATAPTSRELDTRDPWK